MKTVLWTILGLLAAGPAVAQESAPAQVSPKPSHAGTFGYARLGYGRVLGGGATGNAAVGFGLRGEARSFALDVSFLNYQLPSSNSGLSRSSGNIGGSLFKLEALHFSRGTANASAYVGGGLSWGVMSGFAWASDASASVVSTSSWEGSGLQGELTAGYEVGRASEMRVFVQADATLPFYQVNGQTHSYANGHSSNVSLGRRYNSSLVMSVGVGWEHHHW